MTSNYLLTDRYSLESKGGESPYLHRIDSPQLPYQVLGLPQRGLIQITEHLTVPRNR